MSATHTLGHWDVQYVASLWLVPNSGFACTHTMPKDVCMPSYVTGVGNSPNMSVHGDNTTPISNDGVP